MTKHTPKKQDPPPVSDLDAPRAFGAPGALRALYDIRADLISETARRVWGIEPGPRRYVPTFAPPGTRLMTEEEARLIAEKQARVAADTKVAVFAHVVAKKRRDANQRRAEPLHKGRKAKAAQKNAARERFRPEVERMHRERKTSATIQRILGISRWDIRMILGKI